METQLYTIHRKGTRDLRVVGDGFDAFAFLAAPLWVLWHRLWITGAALAALLIGVALALSPSAVLLVLSGVGLIFALERGSVIRAELRLRGWREAACVEARSEAGAEELYLTGQAA